MSASMKVSSPRGSDITMEEMHALNKTYTDLKKEVDELDPNQLNATDLTRIQSKLNETLQTMMKEQTVVNIAFTEAIQDIPTLIERCSLLLKTATPKSTVTFVDAAASRTLSPERKSRHPEKEDGSDKVKVRKHRKKRHSLHIPTDQQPKSILRPTSPSLRSTHTTTSPKHRPSSPVSFSPEITSSMGKTQTDSHFIDPLDLLDTPTTSSPTRAASPPLIPSKTGELDAVNVDHLKGHKKKRNKHTDISSSDNEASDRTKKKNPLQKAGNFIKGIFSPKPQSRPSTPTIDSYSLLNPGYT